MSALYSILPGIAFADTLAAGLLSRYTADPLKLADCMVLLPTRRACRTLKEAFLRQSAGKALLLPRLVPLGDLDAEELALTAGTDIPPAISPRRRQLLLAQLVQRFNPDWLPAQHLAFARQLGRLLDDIAIEQVDISKLDELAQGDRISEHWQITLNFLKPVLALWPGILAEEGVIDAVERRNLLLGAQAKAWSEHPPQTPIIAAGMTGVIPAIATLLKSILTLPQGEIVLPGLPLAAETVLWWEQIDETHPLYGLKDLLHKLDVPHTRVMPWSVMTDTSDVRRELLHAALLPAPATTRWANLEPLTVGGLVRVDCASEQEEATFIALRLREVLETKGRTGTLITADRNLGRRVGQMLRRWGLGIDDSAGNPLAKTTPATFLRLLLAYAEMPDGHNLLALLKHPLMLAGVSAQECRQRARQIEIKSLRGEPRILGLSALLKRNPPHAEWLGEISAIIAPLLALTAQPTLKLTELLTTLVTTAEQLSDKDKLWRAEAGEALATWVSELLRDARDYPPLAVTELSSVLLTLMSDVMVRLRYGDHPRLTLLGPLEARLQSADLVIIAGLNEGNWPAPPDPDPWMSRPMRKDFGLKSLQQRLGEEAHDFYTLAASGEVILCRSLRQDGAPSVPARWLRRLDMLLSAQKQTAPYIAGEAMLAQARLLDEVESVKPNARPEPRPPLSARPTELWVTDVEKLRSDPYSIYAKKILRLKPLDEIEPEPGHAERGTFIHKVLHRFIRDHLEFLPADPMPLLLQIGEEELIKAGLDNERALWWPRFIRAMEWFVATERQTRNEGQPVATEVEGSITLSEGFVLRAKADRIDYRHKGKALAIIDYKTGSAPGETDRKKNIAVQLPLEAQIAGLGGFKAIPALPVSELSFWKISGGEPAGLRINLEYKAKIAPALMAQEAVAALEELLARFREVETPYTSLPDPDLAPRYNDYLHLARAKEWASSGDEE